MTDEVMMTGNENWDNLIIAIVIQAKRDYFASASYARSTSSTTEYLHRDAENFFASKWFKRLTGLDGLEVLNYLDRRAENEIR